MISGQIVEVFEYDKPILEGFEDKRHTGRASQACQEDVELNRERVLHRARREIRRLVNTNFIPTSKFITLTFRDNLTDVEVANYEFTKFIQRLSYQIGFKISYLAVVEFQKRGAIHFHVIMFNMPYMANKRLNEIWGNGFVKINNIDKVDNVGAYVCKYLQKDLFNGADKLKGKKCYFTSRGLKKPIEIKEESRVQEIAVSLPASKLKYEDTFNGEYLSTHYKQYNMR